MSKLIDSQEEELKVETGEWLPLMESFYTVQGEGAHTGKAAHFLRIGGCDVGCHWCDVKESWNAKLHPVTEVKDIVDSIDPRSNTVVVTGGEPLSWNMDPLTQAIRPLALQTHIETSGAFELSGSWDWICLSPKKTAPPMPSILPRANELKVVVYNRSDLEWAESHAEQMGTDCALFLQPEWSKKEEMMPLICDYVLEHPRWKISLQTHKYLGMP
jgi:7-carboxy-7-deazaguanine synthase